MPGSILVAEFLGRGFINEFRMLVLNVEASDYAKYIGKEHLRTASIEIRRLSGAYFAKKRTKFCLLSVAAIDETRC